MDFESVSKVDVPDTQTAAIDALATDEIHRPPADYAKVLEKAQLNVADLERELKMKQAEAAYWKAKVEELQGSDWLEQIKVELYNRLLTELGETGFERFLQTVERFEPTTDGTTDAYQQVNSVLDGMMETLQAGKK